ncbi:MULTISPECIES: sigma factor-like helix-turn-helix DNA-binding protein [unclassified Amycolatopsis]|uniref:sigma factor-like helix-turn-helix DNA-binding protein n=1 Tax=unclassified Amycolatopsis TaxID=2618356 RepID=UPI0034536551
MTTTPELFDGERGRLFGLAYRLLGSAADAEDAVQDAYLRWRRADHAGITAPRAWLTKAVTNLCLTRLTAAHARHESAAGDALPEPVLTGGGALGPLETVEQRESVSFAMLVLMRALTPVERAVFVLRTAFDYPYPELASLLDLTEAGVRQHYSRARRRVDAGETRFPTSDSGSMRLTESFMTAVRSGRLERLEDLLVADIATWMDLGGGERVHVRGRDAVRRNAAATLARFADVSDFVLTEVNGGPGILFLSGGTVVGLTVVETRGGRISALRTVADPARLAFLRAQWNAVAGVSRGNEESFFRRLVIAVGDLAQPAAAQIALLEKQGLRDADELALEFDGYFAALKHALPADIVAVLAELDALLEEMSGPTGPWSFEALATAPEWVRVRELAARAFALLGRSA